VTLLFNGGIEKPFPVRDRVLVPSQKGGKPMIGTRGQMSAGGIADAVINGDWRSRLDLVVVNLTNADMGGTQAKMEPTN